jgi:hypothetical protein
MLSRFFIGAIQTMLQTFSNNMKQLLLLSFLLSFAFRVNAQSPKLPGPYLSIAEDTVVSKQKLLNGFSLLITDTSYTLVSFQLSYEHADSVCYITNEGSRFNIMSPLFRSTLPQAPLQSLIVVDNIRVVRNGRRHILPSFWLRLVD